MDLSFLMDQVKRAIFNDPTTPHQEGNDPSGLIGNIEQIFGNFGRQQPAQRQVLPASQDPLGDPADMHPQTGYATYGQREYPNVRPASEDPLGDPADQERYPNIRPASEDPLGDPADLEPRRRGW